MKYYKVCHIKSVYYPPFMGTTIREYPEQSAKIGHRIQFIAIKDEKQLLNESINSVNVNRIMVPENMFFRDLFFVFKTLKILSKNQFDIIHVYAFGKCFMLPLIGKFLPKYKKTKWFHNLRQVNTVGGLKGFLQNKKAKFASYFFDAIIVSDNREDSEIKRRILGDHFIKPCFLVPFGANVTRFGLVEEAKINELKQEYEIKERQVILMHIGSIVKLRNLHVLIRAFKKISDRINNVKLFFVGSGNDTDQLIQLSKELQIDDKVTFTGYVEYDNMPAYLKMADIGIAYIPINKFLDCQPPLKTIEYLASGLPVIATNTAGNRNFVKHGFNGLLANDDEDSYAEAIASLVTNEQLRKQLAQNAVGSVDQFDWAKIVKNQLIPVYKEVLGDSK